MSENNSIQYANEYLLSECKLYTAGGLELDLSSLVTSVNIYEDIFNNSITGDIAFTDTNNILGNASIVGQEKLSLILATPDGTDVYDRENAIDFSQTPFYIYKVNSSQLINDRSMGYTISFTTAEIVRNGHIRVSQSYKGEPAIDIIKKVVRDSELLNSKKELFFEETSNNYKIIAPNMRPFDFINMVARKSLSKEYNFAPTFLFYETVKGYFFRTLDSMMDRKNPRMIYREANPNTLTDKGVQDLAKNLQNIYKYSVVSATDTLASQRAGMYASKMLEIDLYNKSYKTYDFDYVKSYKDDIHIDSFTKGGSSESPVLSEATDDYGLKLSEYPDSVFYVASVDRTNELFTPMHQEGELTPYDTMNTHKWLQRRKSRFAQLSSSLTLRVEVPGNTSLQAGDVVGLEIMNRSSDTEEEFDLNYTGRYLVTKLHHVFTKGMGQYKHTVHMECVRDTMSEALPSAGVTLMDGGTQKEEIIPLGSADPGDVVF